MSTLIIVDEIIDTLRSVVALQILSVERWENDDTPVEIEGTKMTARQYRAQQLARLRRAQDALCRARIIRIEAKR